MSSEPVTALPDLPTTDLDSFWDASVTPDLTTEVELLAFNAQFLTDAHWQRIKTLVEQHASHLSSNKPEGYGANFDFTVEIDHQLRAVAAMRRKILHPVTGEILEDVPIREVKECLGAANTLTSALLKNHEKIINFERMRAIEQATVGAVQTLPPAQRDAFMAELNERLGRID